MNQNELGWHAFDSQGLVQAVADSMPHGAQRENGQFLLLREAGSDPAHSSFATPGELLGLQVANNRLAWFAPET